MVLAVVFKCAAGTDSPARLGSSLLSTQGCLRPHRVDHCCRLRCVGPRWACHHRAALGRVVSRAFPSWKRSILTEIYLCHACSYQLRTYQLRTETPGQAAGVRLSAGAADCRADFAADSRRPRRHRQACHAEEVAGPGRRDRGGPGAAPCCDHTGAVSARLFYYYMTYGSSSPPDVLASTTPRDGLSPACHGGRATGRCHVSHGMDTLLARRPSRLHRVVHPRAPLRM
jgi:hypothetical protein